MSDSTGFDKTGANGFLLGIGAGYRHHQLRFGLRFRDMDTTEFALWSVMAEAGFALKMRPITPVFMVHAGYVFDTGIERSAFASKLPQGSIIVPNVDLEGVVAGVDVTAAYWITKFFRLGPFVGFDATYMSRAKAPPPQSIFVIPAEVRNNELFGDSGSGLGYVFTVGLRATGDIGF